MKVALVHDWLDTYRGGERVLETMLEVYPNADIFTLFYDPKRLPESLQQANVTAVAGLRPFAKVRKLLLPLLPAAIESFDLDAYDLVLSSSSCVAKGALASPTARHVCYIHSPMRYIWDERHKYLKSLSISKLKIVRALFHFVAARLRTWDTASSQRVDLFLANSSFVSSRVRSFYGRTARVLHPPIDTQKLAPYFKPWAERQDFLLVAGAHVFYKRHDFVIQALSTRSSQRVVIAGSGPELEKLKKIAGSHITFVEDPPYERLMELYSTAKGLVFPGKEDFGMVPVEVMATGCPVLAYHKGGALDSVIPNTTGMFFSSYNSQDFLKSLDTFLSYDWDSERIREHTEKFSKQTFKAQLKQHIQDVFDNKVTH